jgi:phosphoglycolate phosphatase-like HAD superfamily hydrolase
MTKKLNFIFDFDGVLGDTFKQNLESMVEIGIYSSLENAREGQLKYFNGPPHLTRTSDITPERKAKNEKFILDFGTVMSKKEIPLFTEFLDSIKRISPDNLAVVSNGSTKYLLPACERMGLKFSHILAFEDHHSKEEKIEIIVNDWQVSELEIYYFTDALVDVYELEKYMDRSKIIGCAWGYSGYENLAQELPEEQILKTFKDILNYNFK